MVRIENDFDIYYSVANANTSRQEIEIGDIIKKKKCPWIEISFN
tara:strand:- start:488 stop:619 length:132 start_codon:yes stop_codon:yes gene_type:complete